MIKPALYLLHSPSSKVILSYLPYLASSILSSPISSYMYFTQVLCFTFPLLAIPQCPLFPLLRHTHTDCKPLNSKLCWASPAKAAIPLPVKAGHHCPSHVLHSCTGCTGIFAKSNVSDGYWWDFLSDLWSCACREKETIPNTAVVQGPDAGMRGYIQSVQLETMYFHGKKIKAKNQPKIIFFVTVQYSKQF